MPGSLRVILEVGPKRRVVAGAMDWPGLDRWGSTEERALATLAEYLPRYAPVAERAGHADVLPQSAELEVVERVVGSSSTDFWGIAHVPSSIEADVLLDGELERRLERLQACWAVFDGVAGSVANLRPAPRGGGRDRDRIMRHVYGTEPENFSRKVGVRTPLEDVLTPEGLARHRREYLEGIRAFNAEGRQARTWPLRFLIRRTAHHVMDHAWELQDRAIA